MSLAVLAPEILNFLEPRDLPAIGSGRDLTRINAAIRQSAIMADSLAGVPAPGQLADLGGGDGRFLLGVARRLAKRWPGVHAVIVDRHDIVSRETRDGFTALGWRCDVLRGDMFEILPQIWPDIIIANQFLHHLNDAALARLLAQVSARGKAFVACEPRGGRLALSGVQLMGVLGATNLTHQDAVASARAGFRGYDLSALWPKTGSWRLYEKVVFPFTHVFQAHAI
jgi:hypothetical protein